MRFVIAALIAVISPFALASSETMGFNYTNADLTDVLKEYSKWTGQKFVVDPSVKAKVTVFSPQPVGREEAFNLLSSAMAANGYAISKQGDTMYVSSARNIQRNLLEVTSDLPSMKPERMVTWVINLKYVKADEVNKQLRILTSRDGELVPFTDRNQLIVTDWASNLQRIGQLIGKIDVQKTKK